MEIPTSLFPTGDGSTYSWTRENQFNKYVQEYEIFRKSLQQGYASEKSKPRLIWMSTHMGMMCLNKFRNAMTTYEQLWIQLSKIESLEAAKFHLVGSSSNGLSGRESDLDFLVMTKKGTNVECRAQLVQEVVKAINELGVELTFNGVGKKIVAKPKPAVGGLIKLYADGEEPVDLVLDRSNSFFYRQMLMCYFAFNPHYFFILRRLKLMVRKRGLVTLSGHTMTILALQALQEIGAPDLLKICPTLFQNPTGTPNPHYVVNYLSTKNDSEEPQSKRADNKVTLTDLYIRLLNKLIGLNMQSNVVGLRGSDSIELCKMRLVEYNSEEEWKGQFLVVDPFTYLNVWKKVSNDDAANFKTVLERELDDVKKLE